MPEQLNLARLEAACSSIVPWGRPGSDISLPTVTLREVSIKRVSGFVPSTGSPMETDGHREWFSNRLQTTNLLSLSSRASQTSPSPPCPNFFRGVNASGSGPLGSGCEAIPLSSAANTRQLPFGAGDLAGHAQRLSNAAQCCAKIRP